MSECSRCAGLEQAVKRWQDRAKGVVKAKMSENIIRVEHLTEPRKRRLIHLRLGYVDSPDLSTDELNQLDEMHKFKDVEKYYWSPRTGWVAVVIANQAKSQLRDVVRELKRTR